jgi:hypothetical protein
VRKERKENIPEIIVYPDLYTHTSTFWVINILLKADAPSVACQTLPSLNYHVSDQLTMIHQSSTQRLGAGPRLRTSAVEINALSKWRDES